MKVLILILFVFSYFNGLTQNHIELEAARDFNARATYLLNLENPTQESDSLAIVYFQNAEEVYIKYPSEKHHLAQLYLDVGSIRYYQGDLEMALKDYQKAYQLKTSINDEKDSSAYESLRYVALAFLELHQYDSAFYYYHKAENLLQIFPSLPNSDRVYNDLGALYFYQGGYNKSINYYQKALLSLNSLNTLPNSFIGYINNNIANSLRKLNRFDEALEIYHSLLQSRGGLKEIYLNIGFTYRDKKEYDSALYYLSKVEKFKNPDRTLAITKNEVILQNALGDVYFHLDQLDSATVAFRKSIQLNKQQFKSKNTALGAAYIGLGRIHEAKEDFRKALSYYQTAINKLHYGFTSKDIYKNPTTLSNTVSRLSLFEALRYKANALYSYYQKTANLKDLETSLQTFQLASKLVDNIRKSYDSDQAKLFFTNTAFPIYEEALNVAFEAFQETKRNEYLELAFHFTEKSKAAVLAESLREMEIKKMPGIPDGLLEKEKSLKQQLTRSTIRTIEGTDSAQLFAINNEIRDLEIELGRVHEQLEKNPKYFQNKYASTSLKINELQEHVLQEEDALIEFFLGERNIYVFLIDENTVRLERIKINAQVEEAIATLKQTLFMGKFFEWGGLEAANLLYKRFILPFSQTLEDKSSLIVVPDGQLNYTPLEALVTNLEEKRFLIQDFTVSYAYSASLLYNTMQEDKRNFSNSLLSMAPFAGTNFHTVLAGSIAQLPASRKEVEEIGGRMYLEAEATKALFLKVAKSYGIIHLATHAKADSEDPMNSFITFYPTNADSVAGYRLYTNELYNLTLDSVNLVVLSACETGGGKFARGEGVMSLARAFAYAGCPNIVMTLWKANDKATAEITAKMHAYFKEGYPKDEALRQAKLDFLKTAHYEFQDPYYWANFVFIGNKEPLYSSEQNYWKWGFGILLLFLALFFLLKNRRRSSAFPG